MSLQKLEPRPNTPENGAINSLIEFANALVDQLQTLQGAHAVIEAQQVLFETTLQHAREKIAALEAALAPIQPAPVAPGAPAV